MATTRSTTEAGFVARKTPIDQGAIQQLSIVRGTFTLASQPAADDLRMYLPVGFRPVALRLDPSVSLGSSTLVIGNSTTAGKYRAAATLTAATLAPVLAGGSVKLAAQEEVIMTVAAATLPASGTLDVEFWGTYD